MQRKHRNYSPNRMIPALILVKGKMNKLKHALDKNHLVNKSTSRAEMLKDASF